MRKLTGVIVSNKMKKTVVVRTDSFKMHPKYKKYYRLSKKYKADVADEKDYSIGDVVMMKETRPISKEKRWKVVGTVKKVIAESKDDQE